MLGTLLMLGAMLLPDDARLSRGALRWGYVVIGAAAFMDAFVTWVRAWRDGAELPFGRSEAQRTVGRVAAGRRVGVERDGLLVRSYLALGWRASWWSRIVARQLRK